MIRLAQDGPDALTDADRQADGFDFTGFARFIALWREAQRIAADRRMFHWELAFPGVFDGWQPRSCRSLRRDRH